MDMTDSPDANPRNGTVRADVGDDIRDQLWAQIAALDVRAPYAPATDLMRGIDSIRRLAHAHGLTPAVTVTHFIDRALTRGAAAGPFHGWLTMLTDAVASERQDFETTNHFAEACSVRLAR